MKISIEKKGEEYVITMGGMALTFPSWQNVLLFLSSEQFIRKERYPSIQEVRDIFCKALPEEEQKK